MRVFLTGGTGFIGSHTAARLREDGHEVRALARPTSDTSFLRSIGAELAAGDMLQDGGRLAAAIDGCDAVVHAAALVYRPARWHRYEALNVRGTENVLRAAASAGAERAVHVSSVAVYGGAGDRSGPVTESEWLDRPIPASDYYSRSKRAAEEAAWRLHDDGAVRLSTVRPGVVYGERDRLFTPRLARLVSLPVLPVPGTGDSRISVVYAGNVAGAIVSAVERAETIGRAYNLAEDEPLTLAGLLEEATRAFGGRARRVRVPVWLVRGAAAVADGALRALPGVSGPNLRRGAALLYRDNPYDSGRARRELAWDDPIPHAEAMRRTAAWFRAKEAGRGGR